MKIQLNTCRPGNAARILANIEGQQTGRVMGGELMQVNGRLDVTLLILAAGRRSPAY
jgi:hypothetical protein